MKLKHFFRTKWVISLYIIICLTFLLLQYIINDCWKVENNFYKNLIMNIIPTIATAFGLSAVWEMFGKRSFAEDILILQKVSENYIESGIDFVYKSFKDINWRNELINVSDFVVFNSYGYSWREYNRVLLTDFAKNNTLTIILPDYRKKEIVRELDQRFGFSEFSIGPKKKESVESRIKEAAEDYKKIGAKIKLYNGTICTSYYFMNDKCIYAPFKHGEKQIEVPAIKVHKNGHFYEFCIKDKELIECCCVDYEGIIDEEQSKK